MNEELQSVHVELSTAIERIGGIFESVLSENAVLWSILKTIFITKYLPKFSGTIIDAELFMIKSYLITHGFIVPSGEVTVEYYTKHFPKAGHGAPGNLIHYRGNIYHDGESVGLCLIGPYILGCVPLITGRCISTQEVYNGFTIQVMEVSDLTEVLSYLKPVSM